MKWIVAQLGAREHYSFARTLHAKGMLGGLVTDAWVPPVHPFGWLRRNLRERYHPELASAPVRAWNVAAVTFELTARWRGLQGWPLILERNRWFQREVVSRCAVGQSSTPYSQLILLVTATLLLRLFVSPRQEVGRRCSARLMRGRRKD